MTQQSFCACLGLQVYPADAYRFLSTGQNQMGCWLNSAVLLTSLFGRLLSTSCSIHIAMENRLFIDYLHVFTYLNWWLSIAIFVYPAPPSPLPGFHDSHGGSHAWPRVFDRKRDAVAAVMIGCGHSHQAHDSILTGITSDRSRKGNSKRFWISGISTLFAATCSGMCLVYRAAGSVFLAIKHV